MIIGVISDSHRETKVAASAIEWLLARGADLLVHAGDIVESETLRLLRQSGKPYFAVLGNNDEALAGLKNDFNLYDEPFCTEFAGLRLKIMHHPFYLFDEEPAAQNEADGLNLDADLGAGADRVVNLNANFNAANVDKILNGARRTDANFKNIGSASANLKSGQSASLNASLGLNAGADMNSNANLDLDLNVDPASSRNINLNSNASANLAANMGSDTNSKASLSADRAVNLTAPSLSANLSAPNSCVKLSTPNLDANLIAPNLGSNLTASLSPNASGEGKNRGLCGCGADKISIIKIYGHTHFFAAAVDKNGTLVLNPGEICGRKKRLFGLPVLWYKSENCAYFVSARSAKNYKATERKS